MNLCNLLHPQAKGKKNHMIISIDAEKKTFDLFHHPQKLSAHQD